MFRPDGFKVWSIENKIGSKFVKLEGSILSELVETMNQIFADMNTQITPQDNTYTN